MNGKHRRRACRSRQSRPIRTAMRMISSSRLASPASIGTADRRLHQSFRYRVAVRRRPSYAWALLVNQTAERHLSDTSHEGLQFARRLAEDARRRRTTPIGADGIPPLTIEDVAETEDCSEATVRRRIAQARHELWGTLTMGGIYHRVRAEHALRARGVRNCAATGCTKQLPPRSTARRRFCSDTCRLQEWTRTRDRSRVGSN